jgi:hypothetical protein
MKAVPVVLNQTTLAEGAPLACDERTLGLRERSLVWEHLRGWPQTLDSPGTSAPLREVLTASGKGQNCHVRVES